MSRNSTMHRNSYNLEIINPFIPIPEDTLLGEVWAILNQNAAKDIMPYYIISSYGRIFNKFTRKYIKPCIRSNGYLYVCLSATNCKYGQKKYNIHRLVMCTFMPVPNMENLQVNHINGNKQDNYINMIMPDGSIQSNLEWITASENIQKAWDNGQKPRIRYHLSDDTIYSIRNLYLNGYGLSYISEAFNLKIPEIQRICTNLIYHDDNYHPEQRISPYDNPNNKLKLTDTDADKIRKLYFECNYSYDKIQKEYYPNVGICTISDVCNFRTHNSRG